MRPKSIIWFERLFLGSVLIGLINTLISYGDAVAYIEQDPNVSALGWGSGMIIGVWVFSFAISALLWFLIARKASNVAKWILVLLTVVGLLMTTINPDNLLALANILTAIIAALQFASIMLLFFPDATAWFNASRRAEREKPTGGVTLK